MDPQQVIAQQQQQLQEAQQQLQATNNQVQQLTQQMQALAAQVAAIPPPQPPPQPQPAAPPAPKLPKPTLFNGERAATALQPWLVQVKTHLAATPHMQLQSVQAVNVAAAYLGGSALIWYDTMKTANQGQTPFPTWDAFAAALQQHYLPFDRSDDALAKLRNLKQLSSALQYITKYNELMLALDGMDPHTKREMFILGLKPQVAEAVRMQKPADLQAAQNLAMMADSIQYQSRLRQQAPQRPYTNPGQHSGPTPMELGTATGEPSGELNAIKCWTCNEEGHMSYDCPKKQNGGRGRGRGRGNNRGGRNRGGRGRGRFNTHHGAPN